MERIFQGPSWMAPAELAKLKDQLNSLSEEGFIRSSTSPWGTSVLLVKRKVERRDYVLTTEDK